MSPTSPPNLDDLVAEFVQAAERGQAPDPEDWLARHPDHASELAAFLADLGRFAALLGMSHLPDPDLTEDLPGPAAPDSLAGDQCGESFGGYELLGELGRNMGVVYRARLAGTSLVVALKQINPRGQGAAAGRQFRKEIESVAALRHPNIVPVYHVGEHDGHPFYTMALVEGGSLDQRMDRFRGDPEAAATLIAKVARAVLHAHQRQILHRDLKPANILLDEAGDPHVADFGLAARMDEFGAATDCGTPCGSLPWMAPEAVRGDSTLTTAVDVWALGVILYELLTGQRPFRGATRQQLVAAILEREPPSPRAIEPRVPKDLDAICQWCLKKDPDQRYESASAVAVELERWLRDEPIRKRPPGPGERFARWSRRNRGLALAAVFLIALLVAGTMAALVLVREQDEAAVRAVCRDNEFAAELAAEAFLHRLDPHKDLVLAATDDPTFLTACAAGDMPRLQQFLHDKFETSIASEKIEIASLIVLDDKGKVRAIYRQNDEVVGQTWDDRDYFVGARRQAGQERRGRPYVSLAFTSRNDSLDKFAVSVAFRPTSKGPHWVLAATVTTDPTLGLGVRDDARHKVVLLAPFDNGPRYASSEYSVLVHPSYRPGGKSVRFPTEKLRLAEQSNVRAGFAPDDDYQDPVSEHDPDLVGRWIAAFSPVEETQLVVLVQQRYDDVVASQRSFVLRLLAWLGGLAASGLLVFVSVQLVRTERLKSGRRPKS